jgi:hypothetical protein
VEKFARPTATHLLDKFHALLCDESQDIRDMATPLFNGAVQSSRDGATIESMHEEMILRWIQLGRLLARVDPRRAMLLTRLDHIDDMGAELDADETYQEIITELWDLNTTMSRQDYAALAVAVGDDDDLFHACTMAQNLIDTYQEENS